MSVFWRLEMLSANVFEGITINKKSINVRDKKYLLKFLVIFKVLVNYILKTDCLSFSNLIFQYNNRKGKNFFRKWGLMENR